MNRSVVVALLLALPLLLATTHAVRSSTHSATGLTGGAAHALGNRVSLRLRSELHSDETVTAGTLATDGSGGGCEKAVLEAVTDAVARIPAELRPATVTLHLDPEISVGARPVRGIEAVPKEGSLLIDSSALPFSPSVWLHEIAHLRLGSIVADSRVERRVLATVHEGVADYFAAVVGGLAVVGTAAETRDLRRAPPVYPETWTLVLHEDFDPHPLGWALAGVLWQASAGALDLLEDLLIATRRYQPAGHSSPRAVLSSFAEGCPARSRAAVRDLLSRWSRLDIARNVERP